MYLKDVLKMSYKMSYVPDFGRRLVWISVNLACVGDLKRFYSTSVDSTTPYEALSKIDLPKNLHIQQDYHRFHPGETRN